MKRLIICTSLLTAVTAAGCGGTDSPADPAGATATAETTASTVSRDNPCSVLLPSEVAGILGVPSELREVYDEVTCRYHFKPAATAPTTAPAEETFIEVKVHWTDGKTAVMAARMAGQLLGGGDSGFEKLTGVGDEAWLAPFAALLTFSKGDVGVEIDMRMMPGEREKAIKLAQLIASRL